MALTEEKKKKFKLEKKKRGYAISNINNPIVKVVTWILERKVMWNCHVDEVPMQVGALVVQCAEGVQFN